MMRVFPNRRRDRGSVMIPLLVVMVLCASLSAAIITINISSQNEANTLLQRERAFQLAEAGVDWVLSEIRINSGAIPNPATQTISPGGTGQFTIRALTGNTNGLDDDGDGTVDNPEEGDFVTILSTGESGEVRRTLQVDLQETLDIPVFEGALQFNVDFPIVDLNGNSFLIDGRNHELDGTLDPTTLGQPGLSSPADAQYIVDQIRDRHWDQVIGEGGMLPSVAMVDPLELDRMVEAAISMADINLEPGTHSNTTLGMPTVAGVRVTYANGDVHLSGTARGAGLLAIDGDLIITGQFTWVGIVLVRGRVRFSGGGASKHVIGALVAGEEVVASVSETEVTVSGNVEMAYSQDAVDLATRRLAVMSVVSLHEVGNP